MNLSIKQIVNKLIGDGQRFSLSHRILNATAILGIILTLTTSIANYILSLPQVAIILPAISLFYFLGIYINSIKYIRFRLTYNLMGLYSVFFFIPTFWMLNSGSVGGFQYFIFFFLIIIIITTHYKEKWFYVISLVLITIFLIKIEHIYPEYIMQYSNENEREIDISISIVIAMISTTLAVGIFMKAYKTANRNLTLQKKKIEIQAQNLKLINEKLNDLNKSKDTIFSVISHDLKGPVGTMQSFFDMVLNKMPNLDSNQIIEYLSILGKQNSSVYNTLNNLLAWSNSQRNNITFDPKNQCLEFAVKSNIDLLDEIARQKKITIINKVDTSVSAFFDLNLISTVVRNLISNAIKFTPEYGSITISAEITKRLIIVSVKDTGIGIQPERMNKIFDKTSYKTTFGTKHEKGSGLGLKICLDFIEKHNGEIWVESQVKKGSVFKFTLPTLQ